MNAETMNTREAAKKWGCSEKTVREYCQNGVIPIAEKNGGKWYVPIGMQSLPPVTLKKAVYLLNCIEDNILPAASRYWSENKLTDALLYLSDMGFIDGYEGNLSLEDAARNSRVTKLGKGLIDSDEKQVEVEKNIDIKVGIEKGQPNAVISVSRSVKEKRNNKP